MVDGPYGGGNLFVKNLSNYLINSGNSVVYDLLDKDIDVILIINPLKNSESATFDHLDALFYSLYVNPDALIVQRINECDERKNTLNVNKQIIKANEFVDYTIYVSEWISNLFKEKGLSNNQSKVILSGSDNKIFNQADKEAWDGLSKFKLVTHHWSSNWMKGFDSYKIIDNLLDKAEWKDRVSFTYIGNLPKNFEFNNTEVLEPLSDINLAKKLKTYHGHITGSINEPSGNHHIEAMQCGLPVLFINSGGIPEYCNEKGLIFEINELEKKLDIFIKNYFDYLKNIKKYKNNSDRMSEEFLNLFIDLINNKEKVISSRRKRNNLIIFFKYYISKLRKANFRYFLFLKKALGRILRRKS